MRKMKHGFAMDSIIKHHPLYSCWINIKRRCYGNPDTMKCYHNYGGRGIIVCDKWKLSFITFYKWAISNGWEYGLTIERINNDGNYEPSNCTWVTRKEQLANRRNTRNETFNGVTKPLTVWAEELGINKNTLVKRLKNWGNVELAFTTPVDVNHRHARHEY